MDAAHDPTASDTTVTESDEHVVRGLEDERYSAMVAADWTSFAELCDPELVYTHSSGASDTLQSYVAKVNAGVYVYHEIEHPIEKVLIRGDVALVLGRMDAEITSSGAEKRLRTKCLAVWARHGASWRLLAYQPTPVA